MDKLKEFSEKIKNIKSVYGAGGIQNRKNPDNWRQDLSTFFGKNDVRFINPFADNQEIFNPSVMGHNKDGKIYTMDDLLEIDHEKRVMLFKQTEENDLYFMQNVDLQIFYLDESAGFGTYTEFRENFNNFKKPAIIVRRMPVEKLPHWIEFRWLKMLQDGNAIEFKNFPDMKNFFVEHLKYKK